MSKLTTLDWVRKLQVELIEREHAEISRGHTRVTIGTATCGVAAGALEVLRTLEDEIVSRQLKDIRVSETGCSGLCRHEPIVEVTIGSAPRVAYGNVNPERIKRILQEHILGGNPVADYVIDVTPFPTL